MNKYRAQKKVMVARGEASVDEPIKIAKVLKSISDLLEGTSFASAGGEGF